VSGEANRKLPAKNTTVSWARALQTDRYDGQTTLWCSMIENLHWKSGKTVSKSVMDGGNPVVISSLN